jgi:hypothetical protein
MTNRLAGPRGWLAIATAAMLALGTAASVNAQMLEVFVQGAMDNGRGGAVLTADYSQTSATGPLGSPVCCLVSDQEAGTANYIEATGEVDYGRIRIYTGQQTLQQGNGENRGGAIFISGKIVDSLTVNSGSGFGTLRAMVRFDGALATSATPQSTDSAQASATLVIPGDPGLAVTRMIFQHEGPWVVTGEPFGNYVAELQYLDGVPFVMQITATASVQSASQYNFVYPGGLSSADSDLRTTITWLGAEVLDDEGVLVPGATITSDSGFDWKKGLTVPEPARGVGAVTAVAVVAWLRRRRRAR